MRNISISFYIIFLSTGFMCDLSNDKGKKHEHIKSKEINVNCKNDLKLKKNHFARKFIFELNKKFDINKTKITKVYRLDGTLSNIFECKDSNFYYLVINNKIIHFSEIYHCEALFGEMFYNKEGMFAWKFGSCGSGNLRDWFIYDYKKGTYSVFETNLINVQKNYVFAKKYSDSGDELKYKYSLISNECIWLK